jgi:hypothetical protein
LPGKCEALSSIHSIAKIQKQQKYCYSQVINTRLFLCWKRFPNSQNAQRPWFDLSLTHSFPMKNCLPTLYRDKHSLKGKLASLWWLLCHLRPYCLTRNQYKDKHTLDTMILVLQFTLHTWKRCSTPVFPDHQPVPQGGVRPKLAWSQEHIRSCISSIVKLR